MSTVDAAAITKRAPALVAPSEPTPRGALALSALDRLIGMRLSRDLVLVFPRGGGEAARAVREGLARALVPYYPVAGRLAEPRPGELEVECTGEGVWFVEAAAACALEDAGHLGGALLPFPRTDLVPRPPPGVNKDDLLFMMQVTEFKCGGVAVGITYNHLVFDGLGAAQFVNAVAELARGLAELSVSPTWRRESIPGPAPAEPTSAQNGPAQQGPPPRNYTFYRFTSSEFDFPLESINRVKDRVLSESGLGCTTFEAVTAMTWRSRTRAIRQSEPYADVHLGFMANVRPVLCDRLGIRSGYYGNCVYPAGISAPGERVAGESLTALVRLIREAKQTVTAEFTAWLSGDAGKERFSVPLNYGTLMVTEWSRLGYGDVDYGWGGPGYFFPIPGEFNVLGTCVYVRPPVPKQGVRLVMRCVEERHVAALQDELEKLV